MSRARLLPALLLIAAVACDDSGSTLAPMPNNGPELAVGMDALAAADRFLACPAGDTRSVTRTLGPLGGVMELDGHRFMLPVGAVLLPTTFTLTVPASEYVQVEIHANGHDRFQFLVPATVTMSYDRCAQQDIDHQRLSVWYIGSLTGRLLEFMGGTADAGSREITFTTDHLSGFIIAN